MLQYQAQYVRHLRLLSSGKALKPDAIRQENETFVGSGLKPVLAH